MAKRTVPVVKASKTGYSMLKPKQPTAQRIVHIMRERDLRHHDEVLSLLADTYRLSEQMESLLAPLAEVYETTTPLSTLTALVEADATRPVQASVTAHLQQRWGATLEEVDALFEQAAAQGDGNPVASLQELLGKRTHYQQGPSRRILPRCLWTN